MRAILEMGLSLLAVLGLMSLLWLCLGHLLTPAGGCRVLAVLPGRGDGEDLEQAVKGLLWLREGGLLEGRVLIADCGLDPAGKAIAMALCAQEPGVGLCTADELKHYIM